MVSATDHLDPNTATKPGLGALASLDCAGPIRCPRLSSGRIWEGEGGCCVNRRVGLLSDYGSTLLATCHVAEASDTLLFPVLAAHFRHVDAAAHSVACARALRRDALAPSRARAKERRCGGLALGPPQDETPRNVAFVEVIAAPRVWNYSTATGAVRSAPARRVVDACKRRWTSADGEAEATRSSSYAPSATHACVRMLTRSAGFALTAAFSELPASLGITMSGIPICDASAHARRCPDWPGSGSFRLMTSAAVAPASSAI